jgi:Phage late-transcription coactivator
MKSNMATREEKNRFSMMIMERAISHNTDHMDAITSYCEKNNLEIEVAATLINESLKSIIEGEAMELRFIPKGSRLPL